MQSTTLGGLTRGNKRKPINVRIMRKWIYCGNYDNQRPIFMGLVIADAQVALLHIMIYSHMHPTIASHINSIILVSHIGICYVR